MNAVDSVDGLEQLSHQYPITLVDPETRWYSPDIIHIKKRRYPQPGIHDGSYSDFVGNGVGKTHYALANCATSRI